jgi:hypothetical protein
MKPRVIRNDEDLLAAMKRADELLARTPDSDEKRELELIGQAIKLYEDSLAVMKGVAEKAADGPQEGVPGISGKE